jgi:hypothetical protein
MKSLTNIDNEFFAEHAYFLRGSDVDFLNRFQLWKKSNIYLF